MRQYIRTGIISRIVCILYLFGYRLLQFIEFLLDFHLYYRKEICMKTTLNLQDDIVRDAKRRAVAEATTLTDLIVQGLKNRLKSGERPGILPVSSSGGGLMPDVRWEDLQAAESEGVMYR
jgi:hypothetical protein